MVSQSIGILGFGQLGKMLLQAADKWSLKIKVLESVADLRNYDAVYQFGKDCDVVTIEVEDVNVEALFALQEKGVKVHPNPAALQLIKDKGLQKSFFAKKGVPTSNFVVFPSKSELLQAVNEGKVHLPFVQKRTTGGYDGKGVQVLRKAEDLLLLFEGPSVVEDLVAIDKEIAVIVARNEQNQVVVYEPVEMKFFDQENILDSLFFPAGLTTSISDAAKAIAQQLIKDLDICGLLAVEFFVDKNGQLLVNELAPRPHNSGHHTIESSVTSQYEQHWRGVLNLPMGSTKMTSPAAMVNLLGAPGFSGKPVFEGFHDLLATEGVHVHLYGKAETKPYRKMGHVTITNPEVQKLKEIATWVRTTAIIKSQS